MENSKMSKHQLITNDTEMTEEELLIQQAIKLSLQPTVLNPYEQKEVLGDKLTGDNKLTCHNKLTNDNKTEKPQKRNRCGNKQCSKKINLEYGIGIECQCGGVFCMAHRYSFEHECTINKNKQYQDKLQTQLVKIIKEKMIDKI